MCSPHTSSCFREHYQSTYSVGVALLRTSESRHFMTVMRKLLRTFKVDILCRRCTQVHHLQVDILCRNCTSAFAVVAAQNDAIVNQHIPCCASLHVGMCCIVAQNCTTSKQHISCCTRVPFGIHCRCCAKVNLHANIF